MVGGYLEDINNPNNRKIKDNERINKNNALNNILNLLFFN